MKEFDELVYGTDLLYAEDHEWIEAKGATRKIGVSDYAQDQMGDIVFVEMPEVGDSFDKGEEFGSLESVKAVSELYLPVAGEVVAVNEALADTPELINQDPYGSWIIEIKLAEGAEPDNLLSEAEYKKILKGE